MSTRFYLRNLDSSVGTPTAKVLSSQPGEWMVTSDPALTVAGPTSVQVRADGNVVAWYSAPLKAGTISGDITINLWGYESNAIYNVGPRAIVEVVTISGGTLGTIIATSEGV